MWWVVLGIGGFLTWLFSGNGESNGDPCAVDPSQCGGNGGVGGLDPDFPE